MSEDLDATEENSPKIVTKELVERRVEDWKNRLNELFQSVDDWASKNDWHVDKNNAIEMHEELMRKFVIPATEQPILRLDRRDDYALFKPKGLWVIGANGRIDLYTSKGTFIIVDLAEFGTRSDWRIYRASDRRNGDPFKPEMIESLV